MTPGMRTIVEDPFYRSKGWVNAVDVSPDGAHLLVAGGGRPAAIDCNVHIWNLRRKKEVRCLTGHQFSISAAAFAGDGSIVSMDYGCDNRGRGIGVLRVWEEDGSERFASKTKGDCYLAIFPHLDLVVTGDRTANAAIKGWDLRTGKSRFELKKTNLDIEGFAPMPKGGLLLTHGRCGKINLFDVVRRKLVREYQVTDHVYSAAWHPSGNCFATAILPDGASPRGAKAEVSIWAVATGKQLAKIQRPGPAYKVWRVAFSPNGRLLAGAGGFGKSGTENCVIHVWNVRTEAEVLCLKGHNQLVANLAFTPDGKTLFSAGGWDKTVRRWGVPKAR